MEKILKLIDLLEVKNKKVFIPVSIFRDEKGRKQFKSLKGSWKNVNNRITFDEYLKKYGDNLKVDPALITPKNLLLVDIDGLKNKDDITRKSIEDKLLMMTKNNTPIIKTLNGYHLYFKNEDNRIDTASVSDIYLKCGIKADLKGYDSVNKSESLIFFPSGNSTCEKTVLYIPEEFTNIPVKFEPVLTKNGRAISEAAKGLEHTALNLDNDRYNFLLNFSYTLSQNNMPVIKIKKMVKIINKEVFKSPSSHDIKQLNAELFNDNRKKVLKSTHTGKLTLDEKADLISKEIVENLHDCYLIQFPKQSLFALKEKEIYILKTYLEMSKRFSKVSTTYAKNKSINKDVLTRYLMSDFEDKDKNIDINELVELKDKHRKYLMCKNGLFELDKSLNWGYKKVSNDLNLQPMSIFQYKRNLYDWEKNNDLDPKKSPYLKDKKYSHLIDFHLAIASDDKKRNRAILEMMGNNIVAIKPKHRDLQRFYILNGEGNNGKSFLMEDILQDNMIGIYSLKMALDSFKGEFGEGQLEDKLCLWIDEAPAGDNSKSTEKLKTLSGSKTLHINKKGIQAYNAKSFVTIIMSINKDIYFKMDKAMIERIQYINLESDAKKLLKNGRALIIDDTSSADFDFLFTLYIKSYMQAVANNQLTELPEQEKYIEEAIKISNPIYDYITDENIKFNYDYTLARNILLDYGLWLNEFRPNLKIPYYDNFYKDFISHFNKLNSDYKLIKIKKYVIVDIVKKSDPLAKLGQKILKDKQGKEITMFMKIKGVNYESK